MNARTVMMYGQSLLLSGVATGLEQDPDLLVVQVATWADAQHLLQKGVPDVLIFDLSEPCKSQILPLLLKDPHPLLIGLDAECNQAVLLSGREVFSLTMDRVKAIVEGKEMLRTGQAPNIGS